MMTSVDLMLEPDPPEPAIDQRLLAEVVKACSECVQVCTSYVDACRASAAECAAVLAITSTAGRAPRAASGARRCASACCARSSSPRRRAAAAPRYSMVSVPRIPASRWPSTVQ